MLPYFPWPTTAKLYNLYQTFHVLNPLDIREGGTHTANYFNIIYSTASCIVIHLPQSPDTDNDFVTVLSQQFSDSQLFVLDLPTAVTLL